MDINFTCPNCEVLLTADDSMIGDEIQCPSCNLTFNVPEGTPVPPPPAVDPVEEMFAPPREEEEKPRKKVTLTLPSSTPSDARIEKANKSLEVAAKLSITYVVRTIRRSECVVNGKDRFDDIVAEVLSGAGEGNLHSVSPIQYSYLDKATQQVLTDYGVLVIYKKV